MPIRIDGLLTPENLRDIFATFSPEVRTKMRTELEFSRKDVEQDLKDAPSGAEKAAMHEHQLLNTAADQALDAVDKEFAELNEPIPTASMGKAHGTSVAQPPKLNPAKADQK